MVTAAERGRHVADLRGFKYGTDSNSLLTCQTPKICSVTANKRMHFLQARLRLTRACTCCFVTPAYNTGVNLWKLLELSFVAKHVKQAPFESVWWTRG